MKIMYGLLGEHLPHSFSPQIHRALGNKSYHLFEIAPETLEKFLTEKDFKGVNVTMPYKKTVMPYLDFISPEAEKIGAVNTIVVRDGKLHGYNTDYFGFEYMLEKSGISIKDKKVLVLGSGGASATVEAVLKDKGASETIIVSRNGEVNYSNIYKHTDTDIIVNTTPVGMYPDNMNTPVDVSRFKLSGVLDLVYNPLKTRLVMEAEKMGVKAASGLGMLVFQAKKAHEIFFDTTLDDEVCKKIEKSIRLQMCNIVLIGMPGSGKSTVGRLLAESLGRDLIDTDEGITQKHGIISDIFASKGEEYFRDIESQAVKETAKQSGIIIATGGGAILREENVRALRQNGVIFFLNRPPEDITPTSDRPLSSDREALEKRFNERYDKYKSACDFEIISDTTAEDTVGKIKEYLL